MFNKILVSSLVALNVTLFSFIVWYSFFIKKNFKSLQSENSGKKIVEVLKRSGEGGLNNSAKYLVLAFVDSCNDSIAKQLSSYLAIKESQTPSFIEMVLIYNGSNGEKFSGCPKEYFIKNFVSDKQAKKIISLSGIPSNHSATFILNLQSQTLLTNYNYLLNAMVLKELIEVIPR